MMSDFHLYWLCTVDRCASPTFIDDLISYIINLFPVGPPAAGGGKQRTEPSEELVRGKVSTNRQLTETNLGHGLGLSHTAEQVSSGTCKTFPPFFFCKF